jgi:leucyl aminopeptidase
MEGTSESTAVFSGVTVPPRSVSVDLLFIPVFQDDDALDDLPGLDAATQGEVNRARSSGEFRAKPYELFLTTIADAGWKPRRIALIGAGKRADQDAVRARRLAAACGYAARQRSIDSAGYLLRAGQPLPERARAAADGLSAAEFDTGPYKAAGEATGRYPRRVVVIAPDGDGPVIEQAVRRGRIVGESANMARTLANEPANILTPREFAARVAAIAGAVGLAVEVLDERELEALGMRLHLGVARGSAEPPRLIVVRHEPPAAPEAPVFGFVGKGVTFDSGGISIKPADGMERMKGDMSGGAAVAAALSAAARLGAPHRIVGVIPATENMPGGRATRPGDVIVGASGKSVEIVNTDAEGRLILADALWYAARAGATHLVDVATLTGACVVALGRTVSGLFGAPLDWVRTVESAARRAGDRVWHLPIYEEALDDMKSEVADLVNSGGRPGGAITAAAFLREFTGTLPWAHVDIAGTAWAETRKPYQPKGPTGVGVRLLTELALDGADGRGQE